MEENKQELNTENITDETPMDDSIEVSAIDEIPAEESIEQPAEETESIDFKEEEQEVVQEIIDEPLDTPIEEFDSEAQEELISVRPVKFQEFEQKTPNRSIKKNLDILQDISMHVSVELGRTKSSIREVMDLEEGAVVELDKIAGEQVEIFVNDKFVAKGEVIVIEDKFGVRVTSTNISKIDV